MTLMRHDFIAHIQAQFLQEVKSSLGEHEFLVVGDFAENYAFGVKDASQSLHLVSGPTPNKALFKELVAPPWGL